MKSFFTAFGFFLVFAVGMFSHLSAQTPQEKRIEALGKLTKAMAIVEK